MLNLMDPANWNVYSGAWLSETYDGQPSFRNTGEHTYTRAVTKQNFATPKSFRFWFLWMGSKYSTNPDYAGLHFHVGHQSNAFNYAMSLRLDGSAMILQEFNKEYTSLAAPTPFTLKGWTRYQVECIFGPALELRVDGKTVIKEDPNAHWKYARYETGQMGFRLDKQSVRLGSITVE